MSVGVRENNGAEARGPLPCFFDAPQDCQAMVYQPRDQACGCARAWRPRPARTTRRWERQRASIEWKKKRALSPLGARTPPEEGGGGRQRPHMPTVLPLSLPPLLTGTPGPPRPPPPRPSAGATGGRRAAPSCGPAPARRTGRRRPPAPGRRRLWRQTSQREEGGGVVWQVCACGSLGSARVETIERVRWREGESGGSAPLYFFALTLPIFFPLPLPTKFGDHGAFSTLARPLTRRHAQPVLWPTPCGGRTGVIAPPPTRPRPSKGCLSERAAAAAAPQAACLPPAAAPPRPSPPLLSGKPPHNMAYQFSSRMAAVARPQPGWPPSAGAGADPLRSADRRGVVLAESPSGGAGGRR